MGIDCSISKNKLKFTKAKSYFNKIYKEGKKKRLDKWVKENEEQILYTSGRSVLEFLISESVDKYINYNLDRYYFLLPKQALIKLVEMSELKDYYLYIELYDEPEEELYVMSYSY